MIWIVAALLIIPAIAYFMQKARKGTPFENSRACTPNIDHLRWMENGEKREDKKRENLW